MNKILKWLLQTGVGVLIEFYRKFGAEKLKVLLASIFDSIDTKLEKKFNKEYATKIEGELLEIFEETIVIIKKEMED